MADEGRSGVEVAGPARSAGRQTATAAAAAPAQATPAGAERGRRAPLALNTAAVSLLAASLPRVLVLYIAEGRGSISTLLVREGVDTAAGTACSAGAGPSAGIGEARVRHAELWRSGAVGGGDSREGGKVADGFAMPTKGPHRAVLRPNAPSLEADVPGSLHKTRLWAGLMPRLLPQDGVDALCWAIAIAMVLECLARAMRHILQAVGAPKLDTEWRGRMRLDWTPSRQETPRRAQVAA
ncbi:hypothetical protein BC834DRAFT_847298 [Gloeopeniophorella convolvens]|nr:hypothetical protein BC834DRAFT_847298 [Gloeopeniophorella convolvens]